MVGSTWLILALVGIALAVGMVLIARNQSGRSRSPGRIIFVSGPRQGDEIELANGRTRIGALEDNDIVIPSMQVSRYHAELRIRTGEVHLWDLQASNKTYVNGQPVKTCELKSGDIVKIGDSELRYER